MLTANEQFDALLYGAPSQESANQFKMAAERIAQYVPDHFKHVHQRTVNLANRLASTDYRHAMKVAVAHVTTAWDGDYIKALKDVAAIQAAAPKNIRWNMAEPTYRKLYNAGQANGYGDDYVDNQPGAVGNDHIDYRRVTHGQFIEEEDYSTLVAYDTDVSNDEHEEDQLILSEQVSIQRNWLLIRQETERKGLDIGCPLGTSL